MARSKLAYEAKVTFRVNTVGGDLGAVFDMLRYDGATVVDWWHGETDARGTRWTLTLRSDRPFTTDRWLSFGLRPYDERTTSF